MLFPQPAFRKYSQTPISGLKNSVMKKQNLTASRESLDDHNI